MARLCSKNMVFNRWERRKAYEDLRKMWVEEAGHQEVERDGQVPIQISFADCSALDRLRIQREIFSFHTSSSFCTPQNACLPNHIAQSNAIKMTEIIDIRDQIAVYFLA